jgi:hypothetical protein
MLAATAVALCSRAVVEEFSIRTHSPYSALFTSETVIQPMGLAKGGFLSIEADVLTPGENQHIYFSLFSQSQWEDVREFHVPTLGGERDPKRLCLARSAMRYQTTGARNSFNFTIRETDLYVLQMTYCNSHHESFEVKGTAIAYNINVHKSDGGIEHLSLGAEREVELYKVLLAVYISLLVVWVMECWRLRPYLVPIHTGCTFALLSKVAEMSALLAGLQMDSAVGKTSNSILVATSMLASLSDLFFLGVLLLTSLGWSLIRDRLTWREKKTVIGIFSLYAAIGFVKSFCSSPDHICSAYMLTEYVIKSLIMLGIIVAMNFNITYLRTTLHDERWHSNSTHKTYTKLKKFQEFRLAFLAYLLLPTVLLVIKITVLSWRYEWASVMLSELLILCIYTHLGRTFRPQQSYPLSDVVDMAATGARRGD